MERNCEGRRGSMTAMNGSLLRRMQSILTDYPEDGVMEMHERLRDRERFSRINRRRVEQMMHGNDDQRDDIEESFEEEFVKRPLPSVPQNRQHQHLPSVQALRVPPWEINVSIPRKSRTRGEALAAVPFSSSYSKSSSPSDRGTNGSSGSGGNVHGNLLGLQASALVLDLSWSILGRQVS